MLWHIKKTSIFGYYGYVVVTKENLQTGVIDIIKLPELENLLSQMESGEASPEKVSRYIGDTIWGDWRRCIEFVDELQGIIKDTKFITNMGGIIEAMNRLIHRIFYTRVTAQGITAVIPVFIPKHMVL